METYSSRLNDLCSTFSPLKVVLSLKDDLMNVEVCREIVILNIISSLNIAATVVTSCRTSCSELHTSAVFLGMTRILVKKNLKNCAELYSFWLTPKPQSLHSAPTANNPGSASIYYYVTMLRQKWCQSILVCDMHAVFLSHTSVKAKWVNKPCIIVHSEVIQVSTIQKLVKPK